MYSSNEQLSNKYNDMISKYSIKTYIDNLFRAMVKHKKPLINESKLSLEPGTMIFLNDNFVYHATPDLKNKTTRDLETLEGQIIQVPIKRDFESKQTDPSKKRTFIRFWLSQYPYPGLVNNHAFEISDQYIKQYFVDILTN